MRKPRPLEPQSTEEHRVYIESELSRLTPEASRRGHGVDKFLRYLEDLSGIVESWDEKFDPLPSKIRESTESRGDMLWEVKEFKAQLYFALSHMKRLAMLKGISAEARRLLKELRRFYRMQTPRHAEEVTPAFSDPRWTLGTNNSNGKSRTFRVLMPLGYLLDIFQNADIDYFLQFDGGAVPFGGMWTTGRCRVSTIYA